MIHALNYTDYLFRPRRPEELATAEGGGAVFSQGGASGRHRAHAGRATSRAAAQRPGQLASPAAHRRRVYSALLRFESGAYASPNYNGYAHFDSDAWMDWVGEMGGAKQPQDYGGARRKLAALESPDDEAQAQGCRNLWRRAVCAAPSARGASTPLSHQHFGPIIVSCERADLRPMSIGIHVYGDARREIRPLPCPRRRAMSDRRTPRRDPPWPAPCMTGAGRRRRWRSAWRCWLRPAMGRTWRCTTRFDAARNPGAIRAATPYRGHRAGRKASAVAV